MNISITNVCNRRCEYCFQKGWYLSKKASPIGDDTAIEMPLNEFESLCAWSPTVKVIKLMGGEPLMHSHLPDFMAIAARYDKRVVFISNISIDERAFADLCDAFEQSGSTVRSFLVNTDYPNSQESTFKTNLRRLCRSQLGLSFSTTLLPDEANTRKAIERLSELSEIYKQNRGSLNGFCVRLSPYAPNPFKPQNFQIHDFTENIISLMTALRNKGVMEFGFDCKVNHCELWTEFIDACRNDGIRILTERCCPEIGMPFDVLVDHSVIWCSSANFLRLNDWRKYPDFEAARRELSNQYYEWWRKHGESEKCRTCAKHTPGYCSGMCIAKTNNLLSLPIKQI